MFYRNNTAFPLLLQSFFFQIKVEIRMKILNFFSVIFRINEKLGNNFSN